MKGNTTARVRQVAYGVSATLLAATATGAAAWVNPLEDPYMAEPVTICDTGSFFVGGVPKISPYAELDSQEGVPHQNIIGQMYVQYMIPKKRHRWPLIFIHGSTHTGAALDATPDGREGWMPYAVRHNLAVFNVDQPGRGRSGFDQSVFHEAKVTGNPDLIPTISRISDDRAWTTWFGHLIPDGSTILDGTMIRHSDPGDPDPPEDPDQPSEAHGDYLPAYPIPPIENSADPAIEARMGAIGPEPNPANNSYLALEYYKQLVPNGENTLPGSVCETCNPTAISPVNTWLPLALVELLEGLGGGILAPHSQSTAPVFHVVRILRERGQLHLLKGIIIPEGAGTSLEAAGVTPSDFDTIPFLMVNGDYRPLATRQGNYDAVAQMNASPTRSVGPALSLDAEDPMFGGQLDGHTHMGMLGTTHLTEFDFFLEWADENIPNPIAARNCHSPGKHHDKGHGKNKHHKGHGNSHNKRYGKGHGYPYWGVKKKGR